MQSAGFMLGPTRIVDRNNIYEDVIDMYSEGEIVGEYPLVIKYVGVLVSCELIAGRVVSSVDTQHPVDAATRYSLLTGRWLGSGITGE